MIFLGQTWMHKPQPLQRSSLNVTLAIIAAPSAKNIFNVINSAISQVYIYFSVLSTKWFISLKQ